MAKKTIHVHLGPHKTGSTAIQQALKVNAQLLQDRFGLYQIDTSLLAKTAKFLNADRPHEAGKILQKIAQLCAEAPGDCVLSCEDLAGSLPGVRGRRHIYPHLWRNLSVIEDAFGAFDTRYYFFLRAPEPWTKSAYVQHLKHRQKFSDIDTFTAFLETNTLWDAVIAEPVEKLGAAFLTLPYTEGEAGSATRSFLTAVAGKPQTDLAELREARKNVAPSDADVAIMEKINRSSASQDAKRRAKIFLLSDEVAERADLQNSSGWAPAADKPVDLPKALEPLWSRVEKRIQSQDQPNLMPEIDADLRALRHRIIEPEGELPDGGRRRMISQAEILVYRFRNMPETCFLMGLVISYLRRDTPHTKHASVLFQRLWTEEYPILLGLLPTRWLISTFQTFLDHGINENQRIIGSGAYFYTNILKAYEAERALEGLAPDAIYPNQLPQTRNGFAGLDRFKLGGSDLIVNTNALLLEYSARDEVAGRVVQEFLTRARAARSIFSRMDKSRQAHGAHHKQFANCWSFFEEP